MRQKGAPGRGLEIYERLARSQEESMIRECETSRTAGLFRRSPVALAVAAAIGGAFMSPSVFAQATPADKSAAPIAEVVVTGSNIRRVDAETASPIQIVSQEEIQRTGKTTIGEYLQTLTADGAGSVPKTFGNGFSMGGSGISLRGLGAGSTLVLMNGRRIAPYGLADDGQKVYTDLSVIPLEAVERVEVLKDGASAIYGSDAIAGVVNVILKRNYTGFAAKGSFASSRYSDGNAGKISATYGFGNIDDQRYNVFFNVEASDTDEIEVKDRNDRSFLGSGDLRPYGYSLLGSQFLSGAFTNPTASAAGNAASNPAGAVIPLNNTDGTAPTAGTPYQLLPGCSQFSNLAGADPNGGCPWDLGQWRYLTPREKYVNVFGRGTFAFTDDVEGYLELGYSKKKTWFHNTPSGVSGAWGYPGGPVNANSGPGQMIIGAAHPDNPLGVDARIRYAAFDVGGRNTFNTNDFYRALAGVKAKFGEWDFDAGYLHSETKLRNERTGFLQYSHVLQALSGTGPVTWRIGDNASLNDRSVYDYISPTIHADGKSSLDLVDVKASRSIFALPGGDLGFAVGAEYRHLETSLTPQTFTDQGDIIGLGFSAYDGTQNVIGAYAELLAPVTSNLELSAAVRNDSYMNGDNSTTPKFGVKFQPWEQLALRTTYAKGFRAPNAAENGDGGLAAFANTRDPVRCPGGTPIAGATQADCSAPVAIIASPNKALKPEKSRSITAGFVFQPTSAANLSFDVFEVKREDEIGTETLAAAIAAGKTVRSDNNIAGPNTGTLLAAQTQYINATATRVRGSDMDARYQLNFDTLGKLLFDLQWTHISSFLNITGDTRSQYAGTHGNCDVTNCIGTPKNRINFGATWDMGKWNVSTVVNYIDKFDNIAVAGDTCANSFADGSDAPNSSCTIASFYSVDLSGRWQVTEPLEVFGTVENLFDRLPPLDPLTYGAVNYNPLHSAGAIGRYYTIGLRYSFE
jgi:iron complex outermembrane receptor protein